MIIGPVIGSARAAVPTDHLIIPGVGIGRIHIGMSFTAAVAAWGVPPSHDTRLGLTSYCWCRAVQHNDGSVDITTGGLMATVDAQNVLIGLGAYYDGTYWTPEGLHTSTVVKMEWITSGSPADQIRAAYGMPVQIRTIQGTRREWAYPQRGIAVYTEGSLEAAHVYLIVVAAPRVNP
jgi:hypothetical protein